MIPSREHNRTPRLWAKNRTRREKKKIESSQKTKNIANIEAFKFFPLGNAYKKKKIACSQRPFLSQSET